MQRNLEGIIDSKEGGLDLTFTAENMIDRFLSTGDSTYLLDVDFGGTGDTRHVISLNLTDEHEKPVIPFDDGKLEDVIQGGRGTSFEYLQTRIDIFGYFKFGDVYGAIEGTGWIRHIWGFYEQRQDEMHFVHLNDGRDLWMYKMFSPTGTDYLTDIVIVEPDSKYNEMFNEGYKSTIERYSYDPALSFTIAYASSWTIEDADNDIYLEIEGVIEEQFVSTMWTGSCKVTGEIDGEPVEGRCFAVNDRSFLAQPYVTDIRVSWRHDIDPLPLQNFTIRALADDNVPIESMIIRYNITKYEAPADPVYTEVEMEYATYDGITAWWGGFPNGMINDVVTFKIIVVDVVGVMGQSDRHEVVIELA